MATNFSSLRNSRQTILSKLTEEAKSAAGGGKNDERFWKLTTDKQTGIGYARIRFLPAAKGEEIPWVRVWSHGFKGPEGTWFIENCPTTLGDRACPVCKDNSRLWNTGDTDNKSLASQRKRKLSYISNILVVEDGAHPENNGKVFLFRYGKKIHDKIMELMEPQFPDQQPANPFDLWEGADFKLKAAKKDGFANYDRSSFETPSAVGDDDAEREAIWNQEHPLAEFVAQDQFKSYEDLQDRFSRTLNGTPTRTAAATVAEESPLTSKLPVPVKATAPKAVAAPKPVTRPIKTDEEDSEEAEVRRLFQSALADDDEL